MLKLRMNVNPHTASAKPISGNPARHFLQKGVVIWRQCSFDGDKAILCPDEDIYYTENGQLKAKLWIDVAPKAENKEKNIPAQKIWEPCIGAYGKGIFAFPDNPNCPNWVFATVSSQTKDFKETGIGAVRVKLHNGIDVEEYLRFREEYAMVYDTANDLGQTDSEIVDGVASDLVADLEYGMTRLWIKFVDTFEVDGCRLAHYTYYDLGKKAAEKQANNVAEAEEEEEPVDTTAACLGVRVQGVLSPK